eukprot:Nitzschia sp. Nitz4//scaffold127_size64804//51639//52894//NITZ4_006186-RA/size64804-augustus-gene-0.54-mRNA-1//1//CDS//3329534780//8467//frame0
MVKRVKKEEPVEDEEPQVEVGEEYDDDDVKAEPDEPSDQELRAIIRRLVPKVNLQKTGVKAFIKLLSKECGGLDLKPRTDYVKAELSAAINEIESEDEDDESEEEAPKKRRKKNSGEADAPKKKRAAGKGLSVKKEISDDLANFLGKGKEMARTDIVKALWDYIKEHDLQNPDNKREILLDANMQKVFGCETFTMFTMNKYVAAHIHPFKPLDLSPKEPKPPKKRKSKKGDEPPAKKKRKPKKPGLQPPYRLSKDMADVVGKDILPRPQVVTKLWEYIKGNDLQNPDDKRQILCDEKLKKVMGGNDTVTMFNMNRYITDHLLEKLDRSAYTHDEEEAAANDDPKDEDEEEEEEDGGDDDDEGGDDDEDEEEEED